MRVGAKLVYYHYSPVEIKKVRTKRQQYEPWRKPKGLWISDDDCERNWPGFVMANYNNIMHTKDVGIRHKITLKQDAKIKYITNEKALRKFSEKYRSHKYKNFGIIFETAYAIEWQKLEKKYDGIIITPYLWNYGLMREVQWYYGWDCASGCIWNSEAIESVEVCPA